MIWTTKRIRVFYLSCHKTRLIYAYRNLIKKVWKENQYIFEPRNCTRPDRIIRRKRQSLLKISIMRWSVENIKWNCLISEKWKTFWSICVVVAMSRCKYELVNAQLNRNRRFEAIKNRNGNWTFLVCFY